MTHASLFSGIGGFDLAAEWAGWTNLFNCEIDPFCQRVLKYHFPNAEQYTDIRTTDFTLWRDRIDVLTGGFPCQPFSVAGKRQGTDDPRHLWPEMLRAIREIRPRWIVGENVRGILSWNGGMVFEQVCADLEAAGYEVQPLILPACSVGAPHRRDRVWFVAHRTDAGSETERGRSDGVLSDGLAANTDGSGGEEYNAPEKSSEQMRKHREGSYHPMPTWERFPTQSPVCSGDDGLPAGLDGITVPRWRAESIKAYGNAIVPQVAYRIFQAINEYER
ncbi:DNA cytosine methyltransferase [uncultured Rikenella sp.]|uniref:DNA cytosine methyltransferase n=1 Tax=uncultured Rikenella sp. TaxID=368003 RepID=UPI0025D028DE|nr:DNA cytosine methyltransferase [uncultured Rikenella sp.]